MTVSLPFSFSLTHIQLHTVMCSCKVLTNQCPKVREDVWDNRVGVIIFMWCFKWPATQCYEPGCDDTEHVELFTRVTQCVRTCYKIMPAGEIQNKNKNKWDGSGSRAHLYRLVFAYLQKKISLLWFYTSHTFPLTLPIPIDIFYLVTLFCYPTTLECSFKL